MKCLCWVELRNDDIDMYVYMMCMCSLSTIPCVTDLHNFAAALTRGTPNFLSYNLQLKISALQNAIIINFKI